MDAQAAINEIARDLEEGYVGGRIGSRDDVTPVGYEGEHETYGTQADWLTGEGLTSLWGADPSWGMRSTYPNLVAEYLGEDPVANLFVDAQGMLQRGGGPTGWDYAALALSTVPVVGSAAVRAASPLALATKKAIQDWGKRVHKNVDFEIDQHMTATTDTTWKATGFRETKKGKILERLGMLPEYKDLNKPIDPMIAGWYDDYVLKGKDIGQKMAKDLESFTGLSPQTKDQMLEKLKSEFPDSFEKITKAKQSKVLELSADEYYAMNPQMQSRLLETAGYSKQDLDVYHWVSESRDMQVAMEQLARELGDENSPLVNEIALSIKQKDLAVFERQLDIHAEIYNSLERLHPDKWVGFVQRNNELYMANKLTKDLTPEELFSTTERALYDAHMREGKTASEALELTLDSIKSSKELTAEWLPGFSKSIDDNLSDWSKLREITTELPENITQLPGTKPIQDMTWREWDNLGDDPFKLSSKQNEIMRAQGIINPDNVLDHFWDKGARKDFVGQLEEAIAKTGQDFQEELEFVRERDLHSGYLEKMTSDEMADDIAWKHLGDEFDEMFKGTTEPLAVAQKMAWKPDDISHEHWAQFTQNMTMKEVENAYRKFTLRLID
jgi:hypothetical protein